jgi:hypothetical protein
LRGNGGSSSPLEINFIDLGLVDPSWFENYTFYNGPRTRAKSGITTNTAARQGDYNTWHKSSNKLEDKPRHKPKRHQPSIDLRPHRTTYSPVSL